MKTKLISFTVFILMVTCCTKRDLADIEYFTFGTAYGECSGNCAIFFMIKDNNLYPDDFDYYSGTLSFKNEPLSDEKYNLAKRLVDDFPDYLLKNVDKTFGCPDCADQGGIHIEIKNNGKISSWHIDTSVANQPLEIREYVQNLVSIIESLQ